jgi:hypothetical protein
MIGEAPTKHKRETMVVHTHVVKATIEILERAQDTLREVAEGVAHTPEDLRALACDLRAQADFLLELEALWYRTREQKG